MIEWPLIFLGGFLGASHCIGMCGAFAISIGVGAANVRANLRRQTMYTLGRTFTYAFGGAAAATAGMKLASASFTAFNAQAALAIAAGILLVGQGLYSAGLIPRLRRRTAASFCPAHGLFASFLTAPGTWNAFIAGVLTGFLPCGLVYAYLVLAAGTGNLWQGTAIMAVFGAGTAPLMLLTGLGSALLSVKARTHLLRLAAGCVVVTGLITVGRGVAWAKSAGSAGGPACPFCSTKTDSVPESPAGPALPAAGHQ
ncbi:MAG: sulfite exporter TauE/SafE family protein [Planctomycetia bacterium]|nr:sulfite exporter TauE/SafE family protein [Planctomycetia bacterium]